MKDHNYATLAHIAGEVWGTLARATLNQPLVTPTQAVPQPVQPERVLGSDKYFEILGQLKEDFKKEVPIETETESGEDT